MTTMTSSNGYSDDEILIFGGKIADIIIGGFDLESFTEDQREAMRNAAADACEAEMKAWDGEATANPLPFVLVIEMEQAAVGAILAKAQLIVAEEVIEEFSGGG